MRKLLLFTTSYSLLQATNAAQRISIKQVIETTGMRTSEPVGLQLVNPKLSTDRRPRVWTHTFQAGTHFSDEAAESWNQAPQFSTIGMPAGKLRSTKVPETGAVAVSTNKIAL